MLTTNDIPTHEVTLFPFQMDIMTHEARFKIVAAGRRTGKSYLACVMSMNKAVTKPGSRTIIVSPTHTMAKEAVWSNLKLITNPAYIKKTIETTLDMYFINGSRISLKSADNPDSLRGISPSPDFVVLDEWAFAKPKAFQEVILPMLSDPMVKGELLAISTPKGLNSDFYKMWEQGNDPTHKEWMSWQFAAEDVRPDMREEIKLARATLDPKTFEQEFRASWLTTGHMVFNQFKPHIHMVDDLEPFAEGEAIHVAIDFNVAIMAASVFALRGEQMHFLDEYSGDANTNELIESIKSDYPGRQIVVYPDPSGKARKTSAATGITDISLLRAAGFKVCVRNGHPTIKDSVNAVNRLLLDANGNTRMFFDKKNCPETIKSIMGTEWKEKANSEDMDTATIDKSQGVEHWSDGVRYASEWLFPITNSGRKVFTGNRF